MQLETALDPVLLTRQRLSSRPPRPSDPVRENEALLALADELAQRPDNVLNLLCELILQMCNADSAGVSLLREETDEFVWPAVAGAWAPFVNGSMPRSASPCGEVVDHDEVLIFRDVIAQFPAAGQAKPDIQEILLAPFHRDGAPIGTVWAISHDPLREFDAEDRRVLTSLARFAAAAYQTISAHQSARSAQEELSFANRELGHRMKNLLSMVTAIVSQTLKRADQTTVEVLQNRLAALGSAHKVLIERQSPAASVREIAQNVLGTIGQIDRVDLDGPALDLGPKSALAYSLILHELGTNAVKYGALSNETGRIRLTWMIRGDGPDATLVIRWQETGGPQAAKPERTGFGTKLIMMGLLGGGGTSLDYGGDGLQVELSTPLGEASTL